MPGSIDSSASRRVPDGTSGSTAAPIHGHGSRGSHDRDGAARAGRAVAATGATLHEAGVGQHLEGGPDGVAMGSRLARERPQRRQLGTRGLLVQGGREGVGQTQRPIASRAAPERVDDAARQVVRGRLHAHAAPG